MNIRNIPKELLENRNSLECNFIFSLFKNPELVDDYKNVELGEDIITEDGKFYFGLAKNLSSAGYNTFDEISIYAYLSDKKEIKNKFDSLGGFKTIHDITSLISLDNIDGYYDELMKSNLLIRLNAAGFAVKNELEKFKKMSSEEIYDYYDYKLADISVGKIEKVTAEDLSEGYEYWIDQWDKGISNGFGIGSNLINNMTSGIHRSNLTLHLAGIGEGKTTTAIILYAIPAIKRGDNVLILANEQGVSEFRSMIISTVLFNYIRPTSGLNRQKVNTGNYTKEQKQDLQKAANWIKDQPGKITLVEMKDYNVKTMEKAISKYSRLGYGLIIVDTLKPEDDSDAKSWGLFSEAAKALFLIAKKTDTAIVCTAQLATDSLNRKYLDLTSVGKARSISETATLVLGFRPIKQEEISRMKVFKFTKDPNTGKSQPTEVKLNEGEHYIEWFLMKNRFGKTRPQIITRFNQEFCTLEDIGYCHQAFDDFRRG